MQRVVAALLDARAMSPCSGSPDGPAEQCQRSHPARHRARATSSRGRGRRSSVLLVESCEGLGLGLDHAPGLAPDEQLEDPGQGPGPLQRQVEPRSTAVVAHGVHGRAADPGLVDTQVKDRACGCQSVTSQTALGSPGWRTSYLDPTPVWPLPSGRTESTVGSRSPQRSTSLTIDHSRSGLAAERPVARIIGPARSRSASPPWRESASSALRTRPRRCRRPP